MRIIKRRMMSVKNSSGQFLLISSWISVNGTICTVSRPHQGTKSLARESTFSFASSDVYGGEKKCTISSLTPRLAIM